MFRIYIETEISLVVTEELHKALYYSGVNMPIFKLNNAFIWMNSTLLGFYWMCHSVNFSRRQK